MKHKIFCLFFLMAATVTVTDVSAELQITASANRNTVAMNEEVNISVMVSGEARNIPEPEIPKMDNFRIAGSGRSQSVSIVNGRVSSSVTFKYALYPKKTGEFTIPSFSISYRGKKYSTGPIKIKVTEASGMPAVRNEAGSEKASAGLFVSQEIDKKQAYLGEQITYIFKFYRRVRLLNNPSFNPPSFSGFFSQELPPNRSYTVRIKGVEYAVTEVRCALFAQHSGEITIEPASITVSIEDTGGGDFFSSFFSQGKRKVLRTGALRVDVLPLPPGAPENFTGAVGDFNIEAGLEKENVKQDEPVSLKIRISGTGDMRPVKQPEISGLNNFKVYESVSSENIEKNNYKISGSKSFTTLIMPMVAGNLEVPPVTFSYFDPEAEEYKILKTDPVYLDVSPSEQKNAEREEFDEGRLQVVREDIRHIKFSKGKRMTEPLFNSKIFRVLVLMPVYLWIAALIGSFIRRKLNPGREVRKRRKKVQELFKKARKSAAAGDEPGIYRRIEEISQIIDIKDEETAKIVSRAREAVYSPRKEFGADARADLKNFSRAVKKMLVLLAAIFSLTMSGVSAGRFETANSEYNEGNYRRASEIYHSIIREEGYFEGVLYNLANAYWRMGETGRARLYWEKALKVNPANRDAEYNIGLIKKTINERDKETIAAALTKFCSKIMGINTMTVTVSAAAWAVLLFLLGYYLKRREPFIWGAVASLIIFLILLAGLVIRVNIQLKDRHAVILQKTAVYNAPGVSAAVQGTVPEGRKVVIINETGDWISAGISEENMQFWVPAEFIEKI